MAESDLERMARMGREQAYVNATAGGVNRPLTGRAAAVISNTPARRINTSLGINSPTIAQINAANRGYASTRTPNAVRNPATPASPTRPNLGGGRSGGGGGGGGGAAALPQFNQDQLNWMAELIKAGQPNGNFQRLDLPDYQPFAPKPFDDSYFSGLQGQWNQAVDTDVGTAQQGTQNLINWLGANFKNAYTNPNATYATAGQAPGMTAQSMGRFLQGQGVDPSINSGNVTQATSADDVFGGLWRNAAANEDTNQRNRLGAAQMSGTDAVNRIRALGLGGTAGINMQRGQAKSAYDQRVEDWAREDAALQQQAAQQEAMSNWTQQNTMTEQQQAYRNAALEALLGFLPEIKGTALTMPSAQSLGWA
jgi:hypothetical protein